MQIVLTLFAWLQLADALAQIEAVTEEKELLQQKTSEVGRLEFVNITSLT